MNGAPTTPDREPYGNFSMLRRLDTPAAVIAEAMHDRGENIKVSAKARTRRSGRWIVKETEVLSFAQRVRREGDRRRRARAWDVGLRFDGAGVPAARPHAYVEESLAGRLVRFALVSEFLEGAVSVEDFARSMKEKNLGRPSIARFLTALADAVTLLTNCGAVHADLSGKNILTRDGSACYFIDLDAVALDIRYSNRRRLKNLVQLYDSFCDVWDDEELTPFIARLIPPGANLDSWLARVYAGQARRRARIEAKWKKQASKHAV